LRLAVIISHFIFCAAHHTNLAVSAQAKTFIYFALKSKVVSLGVYPVGILKCVTFDPRRARGNFKKIANNASSDFKNIQRSGHLPVHSGGAVFMCECWLAAVPKTDVGRCV
jgi:hypothetical protein